MTDVDRAGLVVANYYKNQSKVLDIVNSNAAYSDELFR